MTIDDPDAMSQNGTMKADSDTDEVPLPRQSSLTAAFKEPSTIE